MQKKKLYSTLKKTRKYNKDNLQFQITTNMIRNLTEIIHWVWHFNAENPVMFLVTCFDFFQSSVRLLEVDS